jgi:hypothetical protein
MLGQLTRLQIQSSWLGRQAMRLSLVAQGALAHLRCQASEGLHPLHEVGWQPVYTVPGVGGVLA